MIDATRSTGTAATIVSGAAGAGFSEGRLPIELTHTAQDAVDVCDNGWVWISGSNAIVAAINTTKTNAARRICTRILQVLVRAELFLNAVTTCFGQGIS